jgi:hypothetical protein
MKPQPTSNLHRLSDQELLELEDELLLRNELATSARSFFSPGRLVVFFLALLFFSVFLLLFNLIFAALGRQNNPFSIFLYVGCLVAAALAANFLWERIGLYPRRILRTGLHYWPVTLAIVVYFAGLMAKH